jgi:hypothetical protein
LNFICFLTDLLLPFALLCGQNVQMLFLMEGIFSHIWKAGHEIPIEIAPILALGVGTTQRVMSGSVLSLLGHWVHYTVKFMPFFEASLPVIFGSLIPEFCNIMSSRAPNSITSHTVNIILNGISEFISFCTMETDQTVKDAEEEFKEYGVSISQLHRIVGQHVDSSKQLTQNALFF